MCSMDSKFVMFKVKRFESEYKNVLFCDRIPSENIPDTITKVSEDLQKVNLI